MCYSPGKKKAPIPPVKTGKNGRLCPIPVRGPVGGGRYGTTLHRISCYDPILACRRKESPCSTGYGLSETGRLKTIHICRPPLADCCISYSARTVPITALLKNSLNINHFSIHDSADSQICNHHRTKLSHASTIKVQNSRGNRRMWSHSDLTDGVRPKMPAFGHV